MEEIDNIIIDALRNLHCDILEDIRSLKEFTTDTVTDSIVSCLEAISPGTRFPHKLPSAMSLRLKIATNIAEHIKQLGYRGDMGYQTILYYNEVDVRKVLMFLVERLPRETNKSVTSAELGYVPKLVKEIEEKIKLSFGKLWVPTSFLKYGVRDCGKRYLKQGFSSSYHLQTENVHIPDMQNNSEVLKQYWIHNVPDVTKQCNPKNLIPSLLFKDHGFSTNTNLNRISSSKSIPDIHFKLEDVPVANSASAGNTDHPIEDSTFEDKIKELVQVIENNKQKFEELQEKHKLLEAKLTQVTDIKSKSEAALKETVTQIKTRTKTLTVLSNEENMTKLKNLIDKGSKRLIELANQWNQIQTPLLEQYRNLKQNLMAEEEKLLSEQQKLKNIKEKHTQLSVELKDKQKLEQQLLQDFEKSKANTNRSAYTRRILEIIGNIKKQNEEIQKILKDTKAVQKDINNINGQLDRSFTLSDELIFRDAKKDEMARKAYKLLATLHKDCGEVVQAVTDLGLTERECRNLQDQIDAELVRETSTKLERVNADLAQVKLETATLMKQINQQI